MFTVVPEGKRPDTHQFWEALHLGSIPIISAAPNTYHPALYAHGCRCHHPALLAPSVPFVVLNTWLDLPQFLSSAVAQWTTNRSLGCERPRQGKPWVDRLTDGCVH